MSNENPGNLDRECLAHRVHLKLALEYLSEFVDANTRRELQLTEQISHVIQDIRDTHFLQRVQRQPC